MPAPFYNAIKGTTAGTPGTGAFTPSAAATGFRAWTNVPTGWIGLVRYEDGTNWELCWSYWNGTTLSRASTQLYDSSSGSALSLTSSATAALVISASDVQSHLATTACRGYMMIPGSTTVPTPLGLVASSNVGTVTTASVSNTNYLTEQIRQAYASATTANAQAGVAASFAYALTSTAAGHGGWEWTARFGASGLPAGPRLFAGMTSISFSGNTGEPSALQSASVAAFAKDSTDTNIQLLTNDGTATNGTKIDTGIALVANGWYESSIWTEPGSNKIYALLIRLDTGAIWFGSTTTDVPANGSVLMPQLLGGLSSTTGTAFTMNIGQMFVRAGQ